MSKRIVTIDRVRETLTQSFDSDLPVAPEEHLAIEVLSQAAYDLRRFHRAASGAKRELYLDALSWINATDFSWPYSFINVCQALDLCPEFVRDELLADASLGWLGYWMKSSGRVSQALATSFARAFNGRSDVSCH